MEFFQKIRLILVQEYYLETIDANLDLDNKKILEITNAYEMKKCIF